MNKSRLAITTGDPAGIGTEIVCKFITNIDISQYDITIISHEFVIDKCFKEVLNTEKPYLKILEPNNDYFQFNYGELSKSAGKAAMNYIEKAVHSSLLGDFDAIVTAPINKKSISIAGFDFCGHTEYLASLTKTTDVSMLLAGKNVKTIITTTHCPVSKISENLTTEKIVNAIKNAHNAGKYFGKPNPTIAVCGLNPHAGDNGALGNEELTIIQPAIEEAKKLNINVFGTFPADSLFTKAKDFDFIIAMYHDQGMIAVKMDCFGSAVNVTLNLPFIRTSVDHGTAFDIAGKNLASYSSLESAVKLADSMVKYDKSYRNI